MVVLRNSRDYAPADVERFYRYAERGIGQSIESHVDSYSWNILVFGMLMNFHCCEVYNVK